MTPPPEARSAPPLRILMLEDSEIDATLLQYELKGGGIEFVAHRVETEPDFVAALHEFCPDIILTDNRLPGFDGATGLQLAKEIVPEVPVIFVSGTIGEEWAVELLKMGAVDYVLKDRRSRLAEAVRRALREVEVRADRRRAEEQVRTLSRAVEQSAISIMITDLRGAIEYVNPRFEALTGYSAEEARGKNPRFLKAPDRDSAGFSAMWQTIVAGGEWRGEFQNVCKGGQLFWGMAVVAPIRDAAGVITHFVATMEDITEKKRLEAQHLRAQRLETLGSLAGGVAHDLNNILTPIVLGAPLLHGMVGEGRGRRIVSTIEASARRGAELVKQILAFSRGVKGKRQTLSVKLLMEEMVRMARETFPKTIRIESVAASVLSPVCADATQLHQVLLNLCVNARDAMAEGGILRLKAANVEVDAASHPEACPGPYVRLEVLDTGCGMAPEIVERIFDPFFTTKSCDQGTGLGLSTTAAIVRNHDGFLRVESSLGLGTRFEVFLPAAPDAAVAQGGAGFGPCPRAGRGELLLIVDDESSIVTMARTVLESHGYRTLAASEGAAALAIYLERREEIAAVITDLDMPFLGGIELVRALRLLNADLKVVASSGRDDEEARSRELEALNISALLAKPYTAETLLDTLDRVLADRVFG